MSDKDIHVTYWMGNEPTVRVMKKATWAPVDQFVRIVNAEGEVIIPRDSLLEVRIIPHEATEISQG